uniref:Sorting nexin 6 n=1 Tax=Monodelphis domestica TaxID=13616 RepID=A0A5F8HFD9_MONDO
FIIILIHLPFLTINLSISSVYEQQCWFLISNPSYLVSQLRAINVDLQSDAALQVDISDALSERDKVKFTVHTKSSLPNFKQNEFSVVRQHEEFIWLHDSFVENEDYAGYIIPPAPPRPDFDASREKLQKLGEGEGSMTKEEFTKMKQELEAGWITQKPWVSSTATSILCI